MNIRIHLTKEEAIMIYRFLFETSKEGIRIAPAGCTFMQDLLYPLTRNDSEEGREWLFSAGGIFWFLGMVKEAKHTWPVCDIKIAAVIRKFKNAYLALIDELVDDPKVKYMDHDKQPGVDPFEGDDNV